MKKQQVMREVYAVYLLLWRIITSRRSLGTNVYEADWDVLLVLDTCRVDALQEVQSEYSFLDGIDSIWSVGSTSKEWVEQTFVREFHKEIADTAYITGNPFSDALAGERMPFDYGATTNDTWIEDSSAATHMVRSKMVSKGDLGHIEFLQSGKSKTIKPRPITNHTIRAARSGEFDRIIAHYMQPHTPYYSSSKKYKELSDFEKSPFAAIRSGDKSREEVWDAYLNNLRYVLDDIELLLDNVEGEVIITADHGELFGEYGMFYHHAGNPHPALRKVPWVKTEAADKETHEPDVVLGEESMERMTDEQLRALGYL